MAIEETTSPTPDFLADLLVDPQEHDGLVLYPDRIETDGGDGPIAAFRPDAQALRVVAKELGIEVALIAPDGSKKAIYTEHSADWVLPLVELPTAVVAALIANYLGRRLEGWHTESEGRRDPIVRYREIERSADGGSRVREIEGPAEDVMAWLSANRE